MPKFFYQAYTKSRERRQGVIEAENKTQALASLDRLSLFPINIQAQDEGQAQKVSAVRIGRVKSGDIVSFTRQVSNLLDAGLTILAALLLVSRQTQKPALKSVIDKLVEDLKEGRNFSDSLAWHPQIFSSLYISLVKSAEAGGFLKEIMLRLADFLEEEEELRARVQSAMIYPLLIAAVGLITIYVLLSFVIPKLVLVFEDFEQALPLPTEILVNISAFLSRFWWLVILSAASVVFIFNRLLKTSEASMFFDRFKLKVPVLGALILKRQMEQFSRTLSTLLGSGVTILPSLEIVRDVMENKILKNEIERIRIDVRDGLSLSRAINKSRYFPVSVVNIVSVGEESGNLEGVLKKVASNYEREVGRSLKTLTSLLEPAMILVMGSIVAFIVMAMLLPIFAINFMAR